MCVYIILVCLEIFMDRSCLLCDVYVNHRNQFSQLSDTWRLLYSCISCCALVEASNICSRLPLRLCTTLVYLCMKYLRLLKKVQFVKCLKIEYYIWETSNHLKWKSRMYIDVSNRLNFMWVLHLSSCLNGIYPINRFSIWIRFQEL